MTTKLGELEADMREKHRLAKAAKQPVLDALQAQREAWADYIEAWEKHNEAFLAEEKKLRLVT